MSNVMQPSKHHRAYQALGIALAVAALGFVVYLGAQYWNRLKSTDASQKQAANQAAQPGNVVRDNAVVTTPCYSFTVKRTSSFGGFDECTVQLTYGTDTQNKLNVYKGNAIIQADASKPFVEPYKDLFAKRNIEVIRAEDIKLDGETGGLFIVQDNATKQKQAQIIAVSKTVSNADTDSPIRAAYTVTTAYATDEQKAVVQGIIDTWKWK